MRCKHPLRHPVFRPMPLAVLAIAIGLFVGPAQPVAADPFDCEAATVFVSQDNPTQLNALEYGSGSSTFVPIGPPRNPRYNAIAYNPVDDFIYGVDIDGRLLRIESDGSVVDLGSLNTMSNQNAGAIDDNGDFYVMNSQEALLSHVDLGTLVRTPIALSQVPAAPDLTFIDGMLWGLSQGASTDLVRINPVTGVVDRFAQSIVPGPTTAGAAWTFGNGNLGLSLNATGTIYQIRIDNPNSATPSFSQVSTSPGPASTNNDGASCVGLPANLGISKTGPAQVLPGNEITWTLTVHNFGPGISSGYTVTDEVSAAISDLETTTPGCSISGNTLECVGGVLGVNEDATITLTGTADTRGDVVNTATLIGNEEDPDPGNDSSTITTFVGFPPGLCRGTALRLLGLDAATANPAEAPCETDAATVLEVHETLGLLNTVDVSALEGDTQDGQGTADAQAGVDSAAVSIVGVVNLATTEVYAEASASLEGTCESATLSGDSMIASLTLNGQKIDVGSQPLTIPLVVGALHLNHTEVSGNTVTQRALFLDLPGQTLDVVIAEAKAGIACE